MALPPRPLATVSVVTYNGEAWIEACLLSVLAQTYRPLELVVLDNGSQDDTVAIAKSCLDGIACASVIELGTNLGFAAAHNRAIERTRADVICLLNQDAVLAPEFLGSAIAALDAHPSAAAIQGLILRLGSDGDRSEVVDTTGLTVDRSRRFASRDQGATLSAAGRHAGPVFGADGPAPVYRMEALRSARVVGTAGRDEVLDEAFFLYHEDTDLAWRLRLLGWDAWFEPAAQAWHARSYDGARGLDLRSLADRRRNADPTRSALAWRNHRLMLIKNDSTRAVLRDLAPIARREIGSILLLLAYGPRRRASIASLAAHIPGAIRRRRQVQRRTRVTPEAMRGWFRADDEPMPR
jgi:GT2 family glycosyltransferase